MHTLRPVQLPEHSPTVAKGMSAPSKADQSRPGPSGGHPQQFEHALLKLQPRRVAIDIRRELDHDAIAC